MLLEVYRGVFEDMDALVAAFDNGVLMDAEDLAVRSVRVAGGRVKRMEVCVGGNWVEGSIEDSSRSRGSSLAVSSQPMSPSVAAAPALGLVAVPSHGVAATRGSQSGGSGGPGSAAVKGPAGSAGCGDAGQGPSGTALDAEVERDDRVLRKRLKPNVPTQRKLVVLSDSDPEAAETPASGRSRRRSTPPKAKWEDFSMDLSDLEDDLEVSVWAIM